MKTGIAWAPVAALVLAVASASSAAQTAGDRNATSARTANTGGAAASTPAQLSWERTHRASKIIGMDVMNRQGEKVGDVEDIVLDRNGNVAYAVVSTGGFLGVGERLHAVPWRSLQMNTGADNFLLDVDKERLRNAPGFDANHFPDVNNPKWSSENRKHFPAQASPAPAASATTRSTGRSTATNDIGTTTATSGRSGTAAGTATPSDERKQSAPASSNMPGNPITNQSGTAGGHGTPPATGGGTK